MSAFHSPGQMRFFALSSSVPRSLSHDRSGAGVVTLRPAREAISLSKRTCDQSSLQMLALWLNTGRYSCKLDVIHWLRQPFFVLTPGMEDPELEPLRLLVNSVPVDDFCGLSPSEMHRLLYGPFGERSPLQLRANIAEQTLETIPFLRLTEEFLKIIQRDGCIKLTPLGALPRKTLRELYEHKFILEYMIESGISKLTREVDSIAIASMRLNTELMGLTKKAKGKLTLTRQGIKLLQTDRRRELFVLMLQTFTGKFNWAYNDCYTEFQVGQLGWAFSIYLLLRFGNKQETIQFYAYKYVKAFPAMLQQFRKPYMDPPIKWFALCYNIRTFGRFLEWFGFVKIDPHKDSDRLQAMLVRTQTLTEVFIFE